MKFIQDPGSGEISKAYKNYIFNSTWNFEWSADVLDDFFYENFDNYKKESFSISFL